jgi:hypothetical protein
VAADAEATDGGGRTAAFRARHGRRARLREVIVDIIFETEH